MKTRNEDKEKWGIYVIYNKTTNKKYVGKSKNIKKRITTHISTLNSKSKDENRHLINAWHKYGKDDFDYFVVEYLDIQCLEKLKERELFWQTHFKVTNRKYGYNFRLDSSSNMIVHEDTKKLMSKNHKQKHKDNPELRWEIGKKVSEFWKNNPEVKAEMAINVSENATTYNILQFDKDFNLVAEYRTQKILKEQLPDYYLPAILNVCNGNKSSHKGFYWRYRCVKTGEIKEVKTTIGILPKIKVIHKITKEECIYNSIVKAAENTDVSKGMLYEMFKNKTQIEKSEYEYYKI